MAHENCRRPTDNASAMAPHFFKIILSSEPRLRLPMKFVKKYGRNLPSLVFLEVPTGPVWQVELTCSNGEVWLDKGFQQFKEYYSIGFGYLLVFRYDGSFWFHVLIFDTSATEVEYPYAVPKQEYENNVFDGLSPLREEREVDSDNSVEIAKGIQNWQKSEKRKRKFENPIDKEVPTGVLADHSTKENAMRRKVGDDVSIEILDRFSLHKTDTEITQVLSSKMKAPSNRPEKVAVNEGQKYAMVKDSVNEGKKAATLKFALPDHQSKSIGNKSVKLRIAKADPKIECNSSTGHPHHMRLPVLGRIAKERMIAYRRAKAFKSKKPFFISFMQPTYVSGDFVLPFSKRFAQKHITSEKYCDLVLRVPDGQDWRVKLRVHSNARFCWKEFVQHNDLHVGDVCVFERENNAKHPLLNVIIFRKVEDEESCLHRSMDPVKEASTEVLDDYSTKQKNKRNSIEVDDDVSIVKLDSFSTCKTTTEKPEILSSEMKAEIFHYMDKKATGVQVASCNHQFESMKFKRVKLARTQSNVHPPYLKQKIKKECKASIGHHPPYPISGSKLTVTEEAKEKVLAYQRAKAFKSNSPLFISFMQPSYVASYSILCFSKDFARKYLTDKKYCDVVLGVPDGRTWKVKCRIGNTDAKLIWKTFVQDNGLQVGDACVFEWKNDTKCSLIVHIFKSN